MLLFRRIFNFEQAKVEQMTEQRLNNRYVPGAAFPLQAWLIIEGREHPAKVQNISGNGIGLVLVADPIQPAEGQTAHVRLSLGNHQQVLDGRLVQVRPETRGVYCGFGFKFADFLEQKAYLQLLQPIALGQSLQAVPAEHVVQNEPQFIKQVFRGEDQSMLTVWLDKSFGTPLHSFEFQMQDYFCRAEAKTSVLEVYVREAVDSHKGKLSNPVFDASSGLHDEIRQLFRWILPNLSRDVPDDVRAFLQRFAG
ncbi:MAG TPA: PilZ domain-containing protein [Lacunisphaera sp.]